MPLQIKLNHLVISRTAVETCSFPLNLLGSNSIVTFSLIICRTTFPIDASKDDSELTSQPPSSPEPEKLEMNEKIDSRLMIFGLVFIGSGWNGQKFLSLPFPSDCSISSVIAEIDEIRRLA